MLLIQSLASSTLSARRPIDCDAAGPAGDGIMGGSRSVVDGCARGLTPSGPAGHGPPPGAARQKAWRGCGLVGRIAGMPTNLTIQTLLGDVVGSTGHRYAVTDNAGNTTDTVKIITNRAGGYLGVYHTGSKVNLASSTDLVNWVFRRTLDPQATQPTMCALSTGGFLTATEFNDLAGSGGLLRFRHYANLSSLLAGKVNRERTIPRSLSG